MSDLLREAQTLFEYTRDLRRDFHMHPELGFQEVRTAGIVARELQALNLEVSTGIAETGVVALIEGAHSGPTLLLRFDMDALPIQEDSRASYVSQTPGLMHACGHDGHTAIGLAVARLLVEHQAEISGTIKLVFQPAEEGLGGAMRMVAEGVLENPQPDYALSLHLWNDKPFGWYGVTNGPAMAASETFRVTITGKGGHGASPHLTIDPVLASAQIISSLQSIAARNTAPLDSAVVSATSIHSGSTFNVIPQTAYIEGTIRTFKPKTRQMVLARFSEIVSGVAHAHQCQAEIELESVTPAVINDIQLAARVQAQVRQLFPDGELDTNDQTMGSEDMAFMMDDIPGCYFFIGSANSEKGLDAAHHHPRFDFDESALPHAVALMVAAALDLASSPK
jgi:amidohydrolase